MLNTVTMMGYLVKDPELRRTQSGVACAHARIRVERDYAGKGEKERKSDFFDVVVWRNKGEFLSKYFHKGSAVIVQGSLENREYTDRDGNKRIVTEIIVGEGGNVYFAAPSGNGNGGNKGAKPGNTNAAASGAANTPNLPWEQGSDDYEDICDDEAQLPF